MAKKYLIIIIGLLCLALGGSVGYFLGLRYEFQVFAKKIDAIHPLRLNDSSYKFINPLLAYIVPSSSQESQLASLKNNIAGFIAAQEKNGVDDASVYISDLDRGQWIGVNEKDQYNPASMLKVVVMVVYLKDAEANPDTLNTQYSYDAAANSQLQSGDFFSKSELQRGASYTVQDLINKMIIDSDNGAEVILLQHIDTNSLETLYSALNIQSPEKVGDTFTISPRAYSLFFRILFSATYLSRDMSEKALKILSQTTFDDGLVAGVPKGVVVSHKFGEYVMANSSQIQNIELHDCGIIYAKNGPYLLCIMTRGDNLNGLQSVIRNISSMAYTFYQQQ